MDKNMEENIIDIIKLQEQLNADISKAIAGVLKEYGISGKYIFNVRKDADYCQKHVE